MAITEARSGAPLEFRVWESFADLVPGDLSTAAVMVLWLLLVCLAGLLCALVGLVILNADKARR